MSGFYPPKKRPSHDIIHSHMSSQDATKNTKKIFSLLVRNQRSDEHTRLELYILSSW